MLLIFQVPNTILSQKNTHATLLCRERIMQATQLYHAYVKHTHKFDFDNDFRSQFGNIVLPICIITYNISPL